MKVAAHTVQYMPLLSVLMTADVLSPSVQRKKTPLLWTPSEAKKKGIRYMFTWGSLMTKGVVIT